MSYQTGSSSYKNIKQPNNVSITDLGEILGSSIINSIKTVLMIGGFVTLFSVIITLLEKTNLILVFSNAIGSIFNVNSNLVSSFISGIIEFTNGLNKLSTVHIKDISTNIILSSCIIGFGGISVALQVLSIISKHRLSIKKYMIGKLIQSIIAGLYTHLFLLIPIFNFNLY